MEVLQKQHSNILKQKRIQYNVGLAMKPGKSLHVPTNKAIRNQTITDQR